jgi:hypothetical protein
VFVRRSKVEEALEEPDVLYKLILKEWQLESAYQLAEIPHQDPRAQ